MSRDDRIFQKNPDVVFREEEEGAFLFNPVDDALHCMNRVEASICRLCDGQRTVEEICRRLKDEYEVDVPSDRLRQDVEEFLTRMAELRLVTEAD